jgi:methionine aminopeptidase
MMDRDKMILEFAKGVADSLGAFATANQWSVDNLTKQLQQKSLQLEHLQNEMQRVEITFRSRMNFDTEQIRLGYQQQMKQLQEKLEVSVQNLQSSNSMISQQNSLIEQLQTQIVVLENTKIDHVAFKMQASEINERLGVVQLDLYQAVDTV